MEIFSYTLSGLDVALCMLVAMMIGMSRAGVPGLGLAAVPILATVFGGKVSSGMLLPVLCFADLFAVFYYRRHAQWNHLIKLIPSAIIGILLGVLFGHLINDTTFRITMSVIIFISLVLMLSSGSWIQNRLEKKSVLAPALGIIGGFTSMVGNLAGPVLSLYMLAMKFPKNQFIGTAAWFFMILNLLKLPGHIWVWHTINVQSVLLGLCAIPMMLAGVWIGILIVRKIPEATYRWFIILTIGVSALLMLL